MSNKLVSIIIPTYNRAHFLVDTLNCVLNQTYTHWECIIIDDGSTDETNEVVNRYLKDKRFIFLNRTKDRTKGASTCRNIGLEHAKGEFIQFLDSDDLLSNNKIEEQINIMHEGVEALISTCCWSRFSKTIEDAVHFKNFKSYTDFNDIPAFLEALAVSKGYFPLHAYLIKKCIIDKSGFWNEYLSMNDDSEFLIRQLCNTDKVLFAKNSTAYYRWTDKENISNYNNCQKVDDAIYSWKLIEVQLKIRFKHQKINYVNQIKNDLYTNIQKSFPALLFKHKNFFQDQLKQGKLTNSLRQSISRLWKKTH